MPIKVCDFLFQSVFGIGFIMAECLQRQAGVVM